MSNEIPPEEMDALRRMAARMGEQEKEYERLRTDLPPWLPAFKALHFPPTEPVLGPITTQQLVFLHAPPGVGKTMLALKLALSIADAQDFVGWKSHGKQRVMYVDGEMPGSMMQSRLEGAESPNLCIANLPNWGATALTEPVNLAEKRGQDIISFWADQRDVSVLILDNLMSLLEKTGVSMNSDELWACMRGWAIAQRAKGRTLIIIDHSNDQGQLFGSRTKQWHTDLVMRLRADTEEPTDFLTSFDSTDSGEKGVTKRVNLAFSKVRGERLESHQEIVIEMSGLKDYWKWENAALHNRDKALEMKELGMSVKDIAKELGISLRTAYRYVKGK